MTVLVVGSVALDSVETPFGKADDVLGGSGTFFAASASHLTPVQLVGVVGSDYPVEKLEQLAPFVFLANIDPRLQLEVLRQVERPRLVACDTMNFWIESRRDELLELLGHVDLITLNDGEARQLTEHSNLVKAARWILKRGPKHVIIKKGEHGAFMFTESTVFFAPAYPLEDVFDPTGAGDSFAGGFIGYLARSGDLSEGSLRRAVIYGSAMGSFAVERFSIERLLELTAADITRRVGEFHRLVAFDAELPA